MEKQKKHRLPPVPPRNLTEIINRAYEIPKFERQALFADFLYSTGLRLHEALSLKREDIDSSGCARFIGKGNKERIVPIRPDLLDKLPTSGPLFPIPERTARRWITSLGIRVGGVKLWPHLLRHSFIWNGIAKKLHPTELCLLTGHSSLNMLMTYFRADTRTLRGIAEKLW